MAQITRRTFGALAFGGLAGQAYAAAPAPAAKSAWPDATATAAMIRSGQLSAAEAARAAIERAQALQPKLNFLVASDFDRALERGRAGGQTGPFAGVPFLIKDLNNFVGQPTRSGSRALLPLPAARRQEPLIDAYVRTGVNVIGKSSTPEFGFLPTTEPVGFGPTRNPWDPSRSSGGSSGGAAVAVATGVVTIAHASDGGGSIRIPSSCCGVFGLKPSRGRMIGTRAETRVTEIGVENILSRSVRDSAAMFALTEDSGQGAQHPPVGLITAPLKRKLRVGLLMDGGAGKPPSPDVRAATESSAKLMESLGHRVVPTTWPIGQDFIDHFLLLWAEGAYGVAGEVAKATGRPATADQLEPFSLGLADKFAKAPAATRQNALDQLQKAALAYDLWFVKNRFDVILSPVLAWAPPPIGHIGPSVPFDTLIERLIEYVGYTTYHNVVGSPAMSVPLNWTPSGLPVGTMFAARVGEEGLLLQLAYQLELARPWTDKAPPIRAA